MGGNAFASTVRLDRAAYSRVVSAVTAALGELCDVRVPPELACKDTFGDVDVVVSLRPGYDRDDVRKALSGSIACPEPFVAMGHTDSFLTPERYQVDLTYAPREVLDMHAAALGNGDFCVLLNLAAGMGIMLSQHGFFVRHPRTLLSTDPREIARFLGIPERSFDGGTSMTMEEAFEVAAGSKWFRTGNVTRSHRAHRMGKRPMMAAFVARYSRDGEPQSRSGVVEAAIDHFGKRDEHESAVAAEQAEKERAELRKKGKTFLNGRHVLEWCPGVDGPGVGRVLAAVQGERSMRDYVEWLESASQDDLREAALAAAEQGHM